MGFSERRDSAAGRVRGVISRLLRDGPAVARSDGTLHDIFPVAASAAEGEALRDWILREKATRTVEIGLGYGTPHLRRPAGELGQGVPSCSYRP